MDIQIRKALPEDGTAIAELLKSLGWFAQFEVEPLETSQARVTQHLSLCNADDSHSVYLAEGNGEIVGYTAVHWLPSLFLPAPEGYVSELFVVASVRGQGIGTRLLERVKTEATARGYYRLTLVNHRHRESYHLKFYEKRGWQERDAIAHFAYVLPRL